MAKTKSSAPNKKTVPVNPVLPSTNGDLIGNVRSTEELFLSELKDMYWSEKHLLVALPKMIDAATGAALKEALTEHLAITATHAQRIEQAFEMLEQPVLAKKCAATEGLTKSGEQGIESTPAGTDTRDTCIIMSGLKVENFESTSYKGLIKTARKLGYGEVADLLTETLDEENEAANILETLSEKDSSSLPK